MVEAQASSTPGRRWFAVFGGAVAWVLHLFGVYLISEFGCVSSVAARLWLGVSAVAWPVVGLSVGLLAVAIAATVVGYKDARAQPRGSQGRWLARAGWIFSGLFAVIIAFEAIPVVFYLGEC